MGIVTRQHREWLEGKRPKIIDDATVKRCITYVAAQELRGALCGRDYCMPIELQVENLRLTRERINDLIRKGGKVLDAGCGKNADLVTWFKELGVDAEGIDPFIEKREPFLMNQNIEGPNQIPRPDGHYSLIVAHQNTTLVSLSEGCFFANPTPEEMGRGRNALLEILRVLNSSGNFRCWEGLANARVNQTLESQGYEHKKIRLHDIDQAQEAQVKDTNYLSVIRRARSS